MAALERIRCIWTGFVGSPGVSTFYATDAATLLPQLRTFFQVCHDYLPTDVYIDIEPSGDTIESTTGALTGSWAGSAVAQVHGNDSAAYSGVSGGLVQWASSTVLSGRRLRGRTYLVPFGGGQYDVSGQIASSQRGSIAAAAQALATAASGNMKIYQRPRSAHASWTDRRGVVHPAVSARSGGFGSVDTGSMRAVVTELKTRRD
jgi:hypothetical protein